MNETPAPTVGEQCFNCGHALISRVRLCPHCAAPLPTQGSGIPMALRAMTGITLSIVMFLLTFTGACLVLVGLVGIVSICFWLIDGSESLTRVDLSILSFCGLIGLLLLGGAGLCVLGLSWLSKAKFTE